MTTPSRSGTPPPAPNGPPSPATPARCDGCAVSPDGTWIVSASDDGTLRIWDAATGAERAVLVLPGAATAVAFHPSAPMVACGDAGGGVHLAHLVGIDLGPLVVTAAVHDRELTVRCPACQHRFRIEKERLGSEITCPQEGCNTRLRVNSFVIQPLAPWMEQSARQRSVQPAPTIQRTTPVTQQPAPAIQPPAPRNPELSVEPC